MKTVIHQDDALELTAPEGGVVTGSVYQLAGHVVLAHARARAGERFLGMTYGTFTMAKATGEAWTWSEPIYWDAKAGKATRAPTPLRIGTAEEPAARDAQSARVRFRPDPVA